MNIIKMPSFGADMETGILTEWLVKPGDEVKRGDVVAIIETHKGAIELDLFEPGIVDALLLNEGEQAKVGTPIARIRSHNEAPTSPATTESNSTALPVNKSKPLPASELDEKTARASALFIKASPVARARAQEQGISLKAISGSGPDGAIILNDINQAKPKSAGFDPEMMRQAISATVTQSKQQIPHYYLSTHLDISLCEQLMQKKNAERPPEQRLLLSSLLLVAIAQTLTKFPTLNGYWQNGNYLASQSVHLGNAITLRGGGLVIPVTRDAHKLRPDTMMQQLKQQVARARKHSLRSSEMTDASCTVSSIGERGVESLFAVIYPPQVAIIGLGSALRQAVVITNKQGEEKIEIRTQMIATLSADHRVSDGHLGSRFLSQLNQVLQTPEKLWGETND